MDKSTPRKGLNQLEPNGVIEQVLEKLLPHVVVCHLHDNDGTDDQHRLPGVGTVEWPRIIDALGKAPRLTSIQAEIGLPEWSAGFSRCVRCFDELLRTGRPAEYTEASIADRV